jgi:hypothetical protein
MPTSYNHTFYDLNNRRQYPLAVPDVNFPVEAISDLKISVPNLTAEVVINSIYIRDKIIRIVLSADNRLVAGFTSNNRSLVHIGQTYPLQSSMTGYAGFITLGAGTKYDWNYIGGAVISEECLTRFKPSA